MSAAQPSLEGARVLDLFAGSGALGLEALSRGAASVTFVERSVGAVSALRENVEKLGAGDAAEIVRGDALAYALGLPVAAYDLAFADPPYSSGAATTLAAIFLTRRFARELWVEHRAGEPLPEAAGARTRRYGDTAITTIPAPEASE